MKRKCNTLFMLVFLMLMISGCGNAQPITNNQEAPKEASYQPVEIQNNDRVITFTEAPKRAVTLNQHVTEVMLALGLEDSMVGTAYLDDEILPEYQQQYAKIPVLSDKYPSKEVLVAAEPDFVYAGWISAFSENNSGSIEELEKMGMKGYIHESSLIVGPTLEDVYMDIINIGKIFNVEAKAIELKENMQKEMKQIQEKIGKVESPIPVFVFDSGEESPFTVGKNYMTQLIALAGGQNVFSDLEKNWGNVNWEEVVQRNPEIIVIVDYGEQTAEQKINQLKSNPALTSVPAIENERFVVLPLSAAAEGIRAPMALQILAEGFYPDQFKK